MHILHHWRDYFQNRNEGLGTTYERFILQRHFEALRQRLAIDSVLECPSFGMTGVSGINSMWWASEGKQVTVVDHDRQRLAMVEQVWREVGLPARIVGCEADYEVLPFADKSFDMGWNFASLLFVRNMNPLLMELTRVSRKAIVICIPNRDNAFVKLRLRRAKGLDGIYWNNVRRSTVVNTMAGLNWRERQHFTMDAPPWPDIAMSKEALLRSIGFGRLAGWASEGGGSPLCILDHFAGRGIDMPARVLRFDRLENLPESLRRLWAHHLFMLFTPSDPA